MRILHQTFTVRLYSYIIDNTALNGGVIKASNSRIDLSSSIFRNNMAYYAGVIQIDNDAELKATNVLFEKNYAFRQSGVISSILTIMDK